MSSSQLNGTQKRSKKVKEWVDTARVLWVGVCARAKRMVVWWNADPFSFQEDPTYLDAVDFRKTFTPKDGVDYKWAWEYSEKQYEHLQEQFRYQDEKADSIIKYLGGGAGLVAIGSIVAITKQNAWLVFFLIPCLLCAVRAIQLASSVRTPKPALSPPSIKGAVLYAEQYGAAGQATFIGQWHEACEALAKVGKCKSDIVKRAHRWYAAALYCLLGALFVAAVWTLTLAPTAPPMQVRIIP